MAEERATSTIQELASEIFDQQLANIEDSSFELLATIRYDPQLAARFAEHSLGTAFFLLKGHVDRLKYELEFFKWPFELSAERIVQELNSQIPDASLCYKVRLLISKTGEVTVEYYETPPLRDFLAVFNSDNAPGGVSNSLAPRWRAFKDDNRILPSPFTSFKTTKRDHYNEARNRFGVTIGSGTEVLLFNTANQLMEGSITNVAVRRHGLWVTPMLNTGCLCGVMRSFLLLEGYVGEQPILWDDVKTGDEILLFNAVMGVVKAVVE